MDVKSKKNEIIGPGMELIRGGITSPNTAIICACNDLDGMFFGTESVSGCGCGCGPGGGPGGSIDTAVSTSEKNLEMALPVD